MEEENNNKPNKVVEEGKKIAKQALRDGAKKASQKVIAWAAPVIGWIALILIAVGCLNLIVYEIRSFFRGKSTSVSADEIASTASIQMQELVTFNENGGYKLTEDYANDLIEELESKSIDPEKLRFITPNGTNMLQKYMEIELGMMLPETGKNDDFDGLVKIERIKSNGTIIELKYQKYDEFKASPSESHFSINPETFKLVLSGANGIEEHDYQQLIQAYSVPFDFLMVLHSFSENINFMDAVVDKTLKSKEPIILSYVESSVTEVTKKTYTGTEKVYEKNNMIIGNNKEIEGQELLIQTNDVNNGNIESYKNKYNISSIDLSWTEKTNTMTTGYLNLRKADTLLKTVEKDIEKHSTPETQVGETIIKQISGTLSKEVGTEEVGNRATKTINIQRLSATEETITTASSESITLVDVKNEIKVDEFVDLIKRYPKVRNNFETAPSNIFSLLEEQEHTQTHAKIMRYVLYKLTGINYGVTEDDLEYILDESFLQMSGLTGATLEEKIWFTMLSLGYSKEATAGVLGNLDWESEGMASNKIQDYIISGYTSETYTDAVDNGTYTNFVYDGVGYGLAQWTYPPRKEGLYAFAQNEEVSISDEDLQIHYMLGELGHSEYANTYASNQLYARNGYTIDSWKNAKTPEEAALAFCWIFENPTEGFDAHEPDRIRLANSYYEKFKDLDAGGIFTKGSGDVIGTFQSAITGRTFTIFNQMEIDGWSGSCNRAAQISVCSGYNNWSPEEWISNARLAPQYSMPRYDDLYDTVNLTYKQVSKDSNNTYGTEKIKNQILGGGYIIMYLKGSEAGHSGNSKYGRHWANKMHWIVILGYRLNNGNAEMFISDSGHYNSGWVPIDEFNGGTDADGTYFQPLVDCVILVNEK